MADEPAPVDGEDVPVEEDVPISDDDPFQHTLESPSDGAAPRFRAAPAPKVEDADIDPPTLPGRESGEPLALDDAEVVDPRPPPPPSRKPKSNPPRVMVTPVATPAVVSVKPVPPARKPAGSVPPPVPPRKPHPSAPPPKAGASSPPSALPTPSSALPSSTAQSGPPKAVSGRPAAISGGAISSGAAASSGAPGAASGPPVGASSPPIGGPPPGSLVDTPPGGTAFASRPPSIGARPVSVPRPPSRPPPAPDPAAGRPRAADVVPPPAPTVELEPDDDDIDDQPTRVQDVDDPPRAQILPPAIPALENAGLPSYTLADPLDFAKTQRIERRASAPDDVLPSLTDLEMDGRKKKKGKRRMVKIPDDAVPSLGMRGELQSEPDDGDARSPAARGEMSSDVDDEVDEPDMRPSAPGIFADFRSVQVLRPIEIVSDLPAMGPSSIEAPPATPITARGSSDSPASDAASQSLRRPLPPQRKPLEALDDIEEIVPERMSLPMEGPELVPPPAVDDELELEPDSDDSPKRPPPPPPRPIASEPGALRPEGSSAESTLRQQAMSPSTAEDALRSAELAAAEAELRAREAEAALAEANARQAEAKAREAGKKAPRKQQPWWAEMFEDELVRTLDNPKKKDVQRDVDFMEQSLGLERGSRILDLACGTGVHAVDMATRGYQVVGLDLSRTMLALAREYKEKRGTPVSFIEGDMRQLHLDEVFDGVVSWSASFGYFDDPTNADVLRRVARALRPGGRFVLHVPNRDYIAPRSPTMAWFEKPGCVCMDEMKFDFYSSRMLTKRMVLFDNGRSREIESSIRLYTLTELGRLLQKVGFRVIEVSGHRAHRGAYFGSESPEIMITSERRADDDATESKRGGA
jgi:SAM-dependent methyltransferase